VKNHLLMEDKIKINEDAEQLSFFQLYPQIMTPAERISRITGEL